MHAGNTCRRAMGLERRPPSECGRMPRAEVSEYFIDVNTPIVVAADIDNIFFGPCGAFSIDTLTRRPGLAKVLRVEDDGKTC